MSDPLLAGRRATPAPEGVAHAPEQESDPAEHRSSSVGCPRESVGLRSRAGPRTAPRLFAPPDNRLPALPWPRPPGRNSRPKPAFLATTPPSLEPCSAPSRRFAALRPRASSARGLRALTTPAPGSPDGNGVMATVCVHDGRAGWFDPGPGVEWLSSSCRKDSGATRLAVVSRGCDGRPQTPATSERTRGNGEMLGAQLYTSRLLISNGGRGPLSRFAFC